MGFPSGFYSHAAALARHQKCVAVLADSALVLRGQTHSGSHRYFPRGTDVVLRQLGIRFVRARCLLEEDVYALSGYLLCGEIHLVSMLLTAELIIDKHSRVHNAFC